MHDSRAERRVESNILNARRTAGQQAQEGRIIRTASQPSAPTSHRRAGSEAEHARVRHRTADCHTAASERSLLTRRARSGGGATAGVGGAGGLGGAQGAPQHIHEQRRPQGRGRRRITIVFRFAWRAAASHRTVGWHRTAPQAGGIAAEGGSRGGGARRTRSAWRTEMTHPPCSRVWEADDGTRTD